jgi:hypothetical protein
MPHFFVDNEVVFFQENSASILKTNNGSISIPTSSGVSGSLPNGTNYGDYVFWNGTEWTVGNQNINLGSFSGSTTQGDNSVAIGNGAGNSNQGDNSIAIGNGASQSNQGDNSISIGVSAGESSQGSFSISIGHNSARYNQGESSVSIGDNSGTTGQGIASTCIGYYAGNINQGDNALAIGDGAGNSSQGNGSVAFGSGAGYISQGDYSIAIGCNAGMNNQGKNSIVLSSLGNSVLDCAIPGTIVLAATGPMPEPTTTGFYVTPISPTGNESNVLVYNTSTNEIQYCTNSGKTFIIDHPDDSEKYLIHGCLEGPENGVYYRGVGEIKDDIMTTIYLPNYVKNLAYDFTIQLTPIFNGKIDKKQLQTTKVNKENNSFDVYGDSGEFYWHVYGKRSELLVEPLKSEIKVNGDGPYKYYSNF